MNALTILAEGGDLRRFSHHRQFLKYCGFDLPKNQSGNYRGQEQISKRGNARLRSALWMAVNTAIAQPENSFQQKYSRYIKDAPQDKDLQRKAIFIIATQKYIGNSEITSACISSGIVKSQLFRVNYLSKGLLGVMLIH